MLRVVHISDTHNRHEELKLPEGDVLVHSGGFTESGTRPETERFFRWLVSRPHTYKVVIAGTHDRAFDTSKHGGIRPCWVDNLLDQYTATKDINFYLEHESCDIEGIKFFGSPYTPKMYDIINPWNSFQYDRRDASAHWVDIAKNTDVLVTHTPPYGRLDWCPNGRVKHLGCEALRIFAKLRDIKLHLFGQVHEDYGVLTDANSVFSNASCIDPYKKEILNKPVVFEIDKNTKSIEVLNKEF